MKHLFWLLLLAGTVLAQNKPPCPAGKVFQFGMSSTSMILPSGCFTPAQVRKMQHSFAVNMCGEMGSFLGWGEWEYERRGRWDTSTDSCDNSEHWYHVIWVNKKQVVLEVTKDEYMQATCQEEIVSTDKGWKVVYPKPEWTHCTGGSQP